MAVEQADLLIIGGGPAGLSALAEAHRRGAGRVVLVEREAEAGGAVRHCGHPGFGMLDFGRVWTGPTYAQRLRKEVAGLDVRTGHAATGIGDDATVAISGPAGPYAIDARRILVATGTRETTRAGLLISGNRPFGVMNTGALQRFVYLHGRLPFQRPVIVGSELVAFSAILTLRHLGARPAAMVETGQGPAPPAWARLGASALYGIRLRHGIRIVRIEGLHRVEGLTVEREGRIDTIPCDGVVLSGGWTPETTLLRQAAIPIDPRTGGARVDGGFHTGRPAVLAVGNVTGPARSSGPVALAGRRAARLLAAERETFSSVSRP